MSTFYIKQNDTSPSLEATLEDGYGVPVDLTNASVRFHMRALGAVSAVVDQPADVVDEVNGVVRYVWQDSDTAVPGNYQAEFEVTFISSKIETFPNSKYIDIKITDDIA